MPGDPIFYLVGWITTLLMGIGKGAFGGGLAILGVPLLALVVDPLQAAIMVAVLIAAMDLVAIGSFGASTWSKPDLVWLIPGLIVGIAGIVIWAKSLDIDLGDRRFRLRRTRGDAIGADDDGDETLHGELYRPERHLNMSGDRHKGTADQDEGSGARHAVASGLRPEAADEGWLCGG